MTISRSICVAANGIILLFLMSESYSTLCVCVCVYVYMYVPQLLFIPNFKFFILYWGIADFFGRNDAKAESPVLWSPHAKS